MEILSWKELIGYLAPVFIVLSMMQSHVKKIRLLMIAGCITFIVYGVLVNAWPVVVANALIGVVTAVYLFKAQDVTREFTLLDASRMFPDMVKNFIESHRRDLIRRFPKIEESLQFDRTTILFFMHRLQPVGLFAYRKIEQGVVEILIDYVIPEYRDERTDKYLYSSNEGHLVKEGYHKVIMHTEISAVKEEMRGFGFDEQEPGILIKVIS